MCLFVYAKLFRSHHLVKFFFFFSPFRVFVFGLQGTEPEQEEETCARTNDRVCQDCPCCGKEACQGALHFTDDHIRHGRPP